MVKLESALGMHLIAKSEVDDPLKRRAIMTRRKASPAPTDGDESP